MTVCRLRVVFFLFTSALAEAELSDSRICKKTVHHITKMMLVVF